MGLGEFARKGRPIKKNRGLSGFSTHPLGTAAVHRICSGSTPGRYELARLKGHGGTHHPCPEHGDFDASYGTCSALPLHGEIGQREVGEIAHGIQESGTFWRSQQSLNRLACITIFSGISLYMLWEPLRNVLLSPEHREYYSHIVFIPVVSAYLFFLKRREILSRASWCYSVGGPLLGSGVLLFLIGRQLQASLSLNDHASLATCAAIVFWMGGFVLVYGTMAYRTAVFPMLFLALMIPIPDILMGRIITLLQVGSTQASWILFKLIGIPFTHEGLTFHLPGLSIEVASECSGIRSSLSLFITGLLAAHLFLQEGWKKILLVTSVFPIAVFKNGVRIVTLSWLAVHVDEAFLVGGFLHRSGGFLFYAVGLVLLVLVLLLLRRVNAFVKALR